MTRRPAPAGEYEERRNARIRELREQRAKGCADGAASSLAASSPRSPGRSRSGSPHLRRVQCLRAARHGLGGAEPGAIEHGIVQDFVQWYQPEVLADEAAASEQRRVTIEVPSGATDTAIGQLLFDHGLINSQVAFQWAVIRAGREGTLNFGTYDLSPTLRPSEIVAALQGVPFGPTTTVTLQEGLRLEEIVATFGASEITMNLEEFASILQAPPAELLNQHDFLADLPAGRSLEGYLPPETVEYQISGDETTPLAVAGKLLTQFGHAPEPRQAIAAKGLTIDEAVKIASIVEREAVIDEERPLIAAVYIKRYLEPDNPQTAGCSTPIRRSSTGSRPASRGRRVTSARRHRGRDAARGRLGHDPVVAAAPDGRW